MPTVKIIGIGGYTGGEILRILLRHPSVQIVSATSRVDKPTPMAVFRPELARLCDLQVLPTEGEGSEVQSDVTFLSTPNGVAMNLAPKFLDRGERVIDISGDSRLGDEDEFRAWYGTEHKNPQMLGMAVYGCPEINRKSIRTAKLLANPGCYPTASVLAVAPALAEGFVDPDSIIINALSGISGAGRTPKPAFHLPEMSNNAFAYKFPTHQHTPEIEQALEAVARKPVRINFTPHVIPLSRGILATCYADLEGSARISEVRDAYRSFYKNEPFVRLLPEGQHPQINSVRGTNFCDISVTLDDRTGRLIMVSAIDNLIKGAAGLAVQNLNIMFSLEETEGLLFTGLPV